MLLKVKYAPKIIKIYSRNLKLPFMNKAISLRDTHFRSGYAYCLCVAYTAVKALVLVQLTHRKLNLERIFEDDLHFYVD